MLVPSRRAAIVAGGCHFVIARLRGTLENKRPNRALVDACGVGYLVHVPLSTFYALSDLHSGVTLLVYTLRAFPIAL